MTAYLDASALISLARGDHPERPDLTEFEHLVSSELLAVECARAEDHGRVTRAAPPDELRRRAAHLQRELDGISLEPLDGQVLHAACQPLPVVLGTLDAIHLVTALRVRSDGEPDLTLATHDRQLAKAARAFGLPVIGA